MKKLLIAICGCGLLFTACKEHDTPIDFGTSGTTGTTACVDTSYVITPVPPATKRQVLVEEFTGQSCSNCPPAHDNLDTISAHNPGLINVVSMYANISPQSDPPPGAIYDFRNTIALNIVTTVYGGIAGTPAAAIDRIPSGGSIVQIGANSWDGIINTELTVPDSINMTVASVYDTSTKLATITATITYLNSISTPQNLSIYIVEDSITDLQEFITGDQTYMFMDVFRDMVTSQPWGDPLQATTGNNTKPAGQFFQRVYCSYQLPASLPSTAPAINPAHCRVIAFVNCTNGTDIHVMQSAQCKFAP
jgi:hypothetical protein